MAPEFQSFEEFWPYYVGEHSDPRCRAMHYLGTGLSLACIGTAVVTANPLFLAAVPVVGYGAAWVGHFVFEKNTPATFEHPLWSLRGDLKMFGLALRGKMGDEIARVQSMQSASASGGAQPEKYANGVGEAGLAS